MKDAYHVGILKRQLNKNLAALFPAVHDEVAHAFEGMFRTHFLSQIGSHSLPAEYIPITDGSWGWKTCRSWTDVKEQTGPLFLRWTHR
jgi:hypothetical protein